VTGFLVRRGGQSVIVLWAVVTFVFFLVRLSGDPVALMLPEDATAQDAAALRHQLGLDRTLGQQYAVFLGAALHGDFGISLRQNRPSLGTVLERMPATLSLAGIAIALTVLIAAPVGVLAATRPNAWLDQLARATAVVGQSMPVFWLGILLILLFAVRLRVLPAFGEGGLRHAVLPGITLAAYSAPVTMRMLRSNLLDVLHTDYVRTARAKGLADAVVLYKHALRNAAIPVLTVFALRVGVLLGGAVVTEQVFAYPGMGQLVLQAIAQRDYPVVQAFVAVVACMIVALNFVLDVLYALLDPRVRVAD